MYYDAFKRGFAYYADGYMPYGLLNAVAMKYVATYFCSAFFIDEDCFPQGHTTPLLLLELNEDDDAVKKPQKMSGPFLKSKPSEAKPRDPRKNRFVSMGKIVNFPMLPPTTSLPLPPTMYKAWKTQR
jgi:hypothetical protein